MNQKFKNLLVILFIFSMMVTGCDPFGSSNSSDTTSTGGNGGSGAVITVTIDPGSAILVPGGNQKFNAVVTGSGDTMVTWKMETANSGTISADGLYTAPYFPGTYYVIATSIANPSKSAKAVVTVVASGTYDSSTYDTTIPNDSTGTNYHGTITLSLKGSHTASGTTHTYDDSGELTGFTLHTSAVSGGWWMSTIGESISTKASVNNSHVSINHSTTVKFPMTTFMQAKTSILLKIDNATNTYTLAVGGIEVNAEYTVTDSNGTVVVNDKWIIPCPPVKLPLPADLNRLAGSIPQNVDGNTPGMTWDLQRY